MIESKLDSEKSGKKEIVYPVIMVSKYNGSVVLFTDINSGVMLSSTVHMDRNGEFSENWVSSDDDSYWTPLVGSITLSNK